MIQRKIYFLSFTKTYIS